MLAMKDKPYGAHFFWISFLWEKRGLSWLWSYGSWIYNYLCYQCLSPLKLWFWTLFMVRCTQYKIMW